MKRSLFTAEIAIVVACLLFSCARQVTKQPQASAATSGPQMGAPLNYIKKIKKDTLQYIIEFHDTLERGDFAYTLEKMIKGFSSKSSGDSENVIFIKAQAVVTSPTLFDTGKGQPGLDMQSQRRDSAAQQEEKSAVRYGGTVVIYTPSAAIGPCLAPLVEPFPFDAKSCSTNGRFSSPGYLSIKEVSDRRITVSISTTALNALGKPFSAFDVVTAWSNHIKQHCAEGRALFRYVVGIDQFINGREAIVTGFQIRDEKTVTLQLSQSDPVALKRFCTSRLFPASFKAGPYYIKNQKGNCVSLAPNLHYPSGKPFLNSCELKLGKDNNPFLAFSLNRYDAIAMVSQKDVEYAQKAFSDKANLEVLSEDRYFLSLALQTIDLRRFLDKIFDRKDILSNYVKAQGNPLSSIEASDDSMNSLASTGQGASVLPVAPAVAAPIVVLFRNDDPVSGIIAEKLLADISHAGLTCTVRSTSIEDYEKTLIRRDYGIAVGFVPQSIVKDESERLRMASMWFNDETNERARIDSKFEIPLFSIKTYLLYKNKIAFFNGAIEGAYCKE